MVVLLPNGHPHMSLAGTPARAYNIQRNSDLTTPNRTTAGTVTMDGTVPVVFEDTTAGKTIRLFYRAMAN